MRSLSWWRSSGRWGVLCIVVLTALGCTSSLPAPVYGPAVPPVSLTQLRATPEVYMGQTVVLGGEIVRTQPLQDETLLEVLQKPLDTSGQPLMTDQSEGRFLVRCTGFLDPAVYAPGRALTVTGRVEGARTEKIGEHDYRYLLLVCEKLSLWPPRAYLGELVVTPPWAWGYEDPWYETGWAWGWNPYSSSLWIPSHPRFRHHWFSHRHRHHRGPHHRGGSHHR